MTIYWTHTVPCSECRGLHTEYANRPQCQGCESLRERLKELEGKKPKGPHSQAIPAMHIPHKRVSEKSVREIVDLRERGETYRHIAQVLRIPKGTVESIVQRERKRKNAESMET